MKLVCCAFLAALGWHAFGQTLSFAPHSIQNLGKERIQGAWFERQAVLTWGDRILLWTLPGGPMQVVRGKSGPALGDGGCLMDVDGDGREDAVLTERGDRAALVWFEAPGWKRREIARGVHTRDVLPATLHGRRGMLVVHRGMQVRFYEIPADRNARWPSRDVYSFYSATDQGGLLLADVDRDGRNDILCGNYWIQCPVSFELPWRLFAIKLWSEVKLSSVSLMAWRDLFGSGVPNLIVAQGEMRPARLAWFEKPADPKQLWIEHRLDGRLDLASPRALLPADFDGDGRVDVMIGESSGDGRLILFRNRGGRRLDAQVVGRTAGVIGARAIDWNRDGRLDLVVVEQGALSWWENSPK